MKYIKDHEQEMITEINMTPMVDIMLVLLIIFMLVSHFVESGHIRVELPKAATAETADTKSISLSITKQKQYYLNGDYVATIEELTQKVIAHRQIVPELQVLINADKLVSHGEVVDVIDMLRKNRIYDFAINVETTITDESAQF